MVRARRSQAKAVAGLVKDVDAFLYELNRMLIDSTMFFRYRLQLEKRLHNFWQFMEEMTEEELWINEKILLSVSDDEIVADYSSSRALK